MKPQTTPEQRDEWLAFTTPSEALTLENFANLCHDIDTLLAERERDKALLKECVNDYGWKDGAAIKGKLRARIEAALKGDGE